MSAPPLSLESLPEDLLRRIVLAVDAPAAGGVATRTPLRTAHTLACVSRRLRAYIVGTFLPGVVALGYRDWAPLTAGGGGGIGGAGGGCSSAVGAGSGLAGAGAVGEGGGEGEAAAAVTALLARCKGLKVISSEGANGLVTSEGVIAMAAAASESLEDVDIKYIDLSDDAVRPLFGCPKLRKLQLSFGRAVTANLLHGLGPVPGIRAPLEHLDLTWLPCVDAEAMRHIAALPTLQRLYMKNCEGFDDCCATILCDGAAARSMRELSVCYCPISDQTLPTLIECMPKLQRLLVAERPETHSLCGAYTNRGIEEVKARYTGADRALEIVFDT